MSAARLPSFAKFTLGADAASFGVLRGSWSIGSAAGALALTAFWGARRISSSARFLPVAALGAGEWLQAAFSAVGVVVSLSCLAIFISVRREERQAWAGPARELP